MKNDEAYELLSSSLRAALLLSGTLDLRACVRASIPDGLRRADRAVVEDTLNEIRKKCPAYCSCELYVLAARLVAAP